MLRRWRLITGLTLFVFVTMHLVNHSLGLVGRTWLAVGREIFLAIWRNPVGEGLLLAAVLGHMALGGVALYRRNRLSRIRPWEAAQLLLGLCFPPLVFLHIVGTTVVAQRFGADDNYDDFYLLMLGNSVGAIQQGLILLVAWTHGSIGLWFWLRLKPWFPKWQNAILGGLLLLPTLALAGTVAGMREVAWLAANPVWLAAHTALTRPLDATELAWMRSTEGWLLAIYGVLLGGILLARVSHNLVARWRGLIQVTYPGNRRVAIARGLSILDASQLRRVPHAAVCGGRGRCSTCRVRILRGLDRFSPPSAQELRVLARVGAGPDVRLACLARPQGDVEVEPLLPPSATPREALAHPGHMQGQEREMVVLFADLRGFTGLSEGKLPYDIVFLLNRYFRGMTQAVEGAGGRIDKFVGDGVMALFGLDTDADRGCRQALAAARAMALELQDISRALEEYLSEPLRMGIGIHVGPTIVGEMGAGRVVSVTVIGDTVNTASRLEGLTKEFAAELVLSEKVALRAGVELPMARIEETALRGREALLRVLVVEQASELPVL